MRRKTFKIALSAHASSAIDGSEYEAIIEALEPCAYMIGKPYDWRDFLSDAADKYDDKASILLDHIAYSLGVRWWSEEWSLEQKKRLPELLAVRAVYGTQEYLDVLMDVAGWSGYEVHDKDLWLADVSTFSQRKTLKRMLDSSFPMGVWGDVLEYPGVLYASLDLGTAGYIKSEVNWIEVQSSALPMSYVAQIRDSKGEAHVLVALGDTMPMSYVAQTRDSKGAETTQGMSEILTLD